MTLKRSDVVRQCPSSRLSKRLVGMLPTLARLHLHMIGLPTWSLPHDGASGDGQPLPMHVREAYSTVFRLFMLALSW